jgi:hypothetical protein
VLLKADLPAEKLAEGDVGTVVHVDRDGKAYEVEFVAFDGETVAVVTLEYSHVRPVQRREIAHARRVTELLKGYWHNGLEAPFYYYRDRICLAQESLPLGAAAHTIPVAAL